MRYKIVAIRDRAIDTYGVPAFVATTGSAIRSFSDEVNRNDLDNNLNRHPEDFDMYLLGEYDDQTGEFDSCRPQQIAVGKDLVR